MRTDFSPEKNEATFSRVTGANAKNRKKEEKNGETEVPN